MIKTYDEITGLTKYELEEGEVCPRYPFKKNDDFRKEGLYPMHLTLDEFTITENNKKLFLSCNQDLYKMDFMDFIPYLEGKGTSLIVFARETIKDYPILHYKLYIANNSLHLEMFVYFAENYLRDRIQFYSINNELPVPIATEHAFQDLRDYYYTLNNYNPVTELDSQFDFLKMMVEGHMKTYNLIPDDDLDENNESYLLLKEINQLQQDVQDAIRDELEDELEDY